MRESIFGREVSTVLGRIPHQSTRVGELGRLLEKIMATFSRVNGDQIGRIFAFWVIVFFGQFFF
jgi:hypothetical protein